MLANVNFEEAADQAIQLCNKYKLYERKIGLGGIWGSILREWLESVLPEKLNLSKIKSLQVALAPTRIGASPKLVGGFSSRSDLIEACLASCHVPLFLDGRPYTTYKGENVVDGSFWYFVTKDRYTGLPLPAVPPEDIYWFALSVCALTEN